MYKQGDREYNLKGTYLEVKHYCGLLTRKLAVMQTEALGDIDFDLLEKYEKDIAKFELFNTQVNDAIELHPEKTDEIKERKKYDSVNAEYDKCKLDFANDRKAQRQLKLRNELFANVLIDVVSDEKFVMDILRNILTGEIDKLEYEVVFAMAVLTDFFTFVKENNPLLRSSKDSMTIN